MQKFRVFFDSHPALYYSIFASLGILAGLENDLSYLYISIFPMMLYWKSQRFLLSLVVLAATAYWGYSSFQMTPLPAHGIEGIANVHIDKISVQHRWGRPSFRYQGIITSFEGTAALKNVPFSLTLNDRKEIKCDYAIKGKIFPSYGKRVYLKPDKNTPWKPLGTFSLTEWRCSLKERVKNWIAAKYSSPAVITLLGGLIIGEIDDNEIKKDFARYGLLHLLAISGFHFGILATLLNIFLRPFLPYKFLSMGVMCTLSIYFMILGWGPSVVRAWMTIVLFYAACVSHRVSPPLNALGVAIIIAIAIDPIILENLGFQFSVLSTAAILLFMPYANAVLDFVFPKHSFDTLIKWSRDDQTCYLFLAFLKGSFAITLATSVIALPLSLYYFQVFPLLSLFYNLFFPFLVSMSITLLILGFLLSPLEPIANLIHGANDYITSFFLNMTYGLPDAWDISIKTEVLPIYLIVIFLITAFAFSIYYKPLILND